jgi:hypothetical protein
MAILSALSKVSRRQSLAGRIHGIALAMLLCAPAIAQSAVGEYQVKAAFLFNFAKFVEWPPGSFAGPADPIRLCVMGADPFDHGLEKVVQNKTVNGRPMRVEHPRDSKDVKQCHILFLASPEEQHHNQWLRGSDTAGILTVGEREDFAREGGIVNFVLQADRIGFEINVDAAGRAGVRISSKLLSLARIVRDEPGGRK